MCAFESPTFQVSLQKKVTFPGDELQSLARLLLGKVFTPCQLQRGGARCYFYALVSTAFSLSRTGVPLEKKESTKAVSLCGACDEERVCI